jgi:ribulose-bisphosphate carboxylase large chain
VKRVRAATTPRKRRPAPAVKSVLRGRGALRWRAVELERYKPPDAGTDWAETTRQVLFAGSRGAPLDFDVRYFEVARGGYSSLERHRHAHVVVGVRGEGSVRLGRRWYRLRPLDVCYIGPDVAHQLRNAGRGRFGFFCVVDAARDAGRPVVDRAAGAASRGPK